MNMKKFYILLIVGIFFAGHIDGLSQAARNQEVHIIPSSHLDRVWLKPFEVNRLRFVNMMDHLVGYMEQNPEFTYFTLDGQVSLIDDYLELRPEATGRLKKLIADGRLLVGPWYTQPNVFMVSGESIIRNLYLGLTKGAGYGPVMNICYLPDCFGVNSQLPQLARGFGMDAIYFERGIPASYQGVFRWQGADKTECLAIDYPYMYGNESVTRPLINSETGKKDFLSGFESFISRDMQNNKSPYSVIVNGMDMQWLISDMPEKVKLVNNSNAAYHAKISNFPLLLEDMKKYYEKNNLPLMIYSGEIRENVAYPIIPASQSTRTDLKMANRQAEDILEKNAEPLSSFIWLSGFSYPQAEINKGWFYLINNQHHDNIAAASHDNDHKAVMSAMDRVIEIGGELSRKSTSLITQRIFRNIPFKEKEFGFTVFNVLGWKRSGVEDITVDIPVNSGIKNPVIIDGDNQYILYPDDVKATRQFNMNSFSGREMLEPVVNRYHAAIPLKNIPALGYKTFKISDINMRNRPWELHRESLMTGPDIAENEFIRMTVNPDGSLTVFDKINKITYPRVNYFHDDGEAGSGFEHRRPMKDNIITTLNRPAVVAVVQNTPFKVTYRIETELIVPEKLDAERLRRSEKKTTCKIVTLVSLKKNSSRIDIETKVDNTAKDHRIRIAFPTFLNTNVSYAEQAFDVVKRPVALPPEQTKNEGNYSFPIDDSHPEHSFVDLSDGKKGFMVVNKGLPLYEVSNDSSKTIYIDIIRSTDHVHTGSLGETEDILINSAQMIGEYTFEYSIIPHQGTWEKAIKSAYEFQYPLQLNTPKQESAFGIELIWLDSKNSDTSPLPDEHGFIELDNDMIIVSALKKHENKNALVVRLYNPTDQIQESAVKIKPLKGEVSEVYETNLLEQIIPDKAYNKNNIRLKLLPKKIITLAFIIKE
jgi:mannosylglycerate hydrolase